VVGLDECRLNATPCPLAPPLAVRLRATAGAPSARQHPLHASTADVSACAVPPRCHAPALGRVLCGCGAARTTSPQHAGGAGCMRCADASPRAFSAHVGAHSLSVSCNAFGLLRIPFCSAHSARRSTSRRTSARTAPKKRTRHATSPSLADSRTLAYSRRFPQDLHCALRTCRCSERCALS
jgi:hypothetical protein